MCMQQEAWLLICARFTTLPAVQVLQALAELAVVCNSPDLL